MKTAFKIIFPLWAGIAVFDYQDSCYTYSWRLGACACTAAWW